MLHFLLNKGYRGLLQGFVVVCFGFRLQGLGRSGFVVLLRGSQLWRFVALCKAVRCLVSRAPGLPSLCLGVKGRRLRN